MKHINEDPAFAEVCRVMNDLSAKKDAVETEIQQIEADLHASRVESATSDPVQDALDMTVGVAESVGRKSKIDRLGVLQQQRQKLKHAMDLQSSQFDLVSRYAGYRVFSVHHSNYVKIGKELVEQVGKIMAINARLLVERKALYQRGCHDIPDILFPAGGTDDQLVYWKRELERVITVLESTAEHYAPAKATS